MHIFNMLGNYNGTLCVDALSKMPVGALFMWQGQRNQTAIYKCSFYRFVHRLLS